MSPPTGSEPRSAVDAEATHRLAAERSRLPVALTLGAAHQVTYANSSFHERFGTADDTLSARRLSEIVGAGAGLRALLDAAYRAAATDAAEVTFVGGDGRLRQGTAIATPVFGGSGVIGLVVQLFEVIPSRELRQANEQLILSGLREQEAARRARESAAELENLLETLSEGVTVFDAAGRLVLINAVGRRIFGFSSAKKTTDDFRRCAFMRPDGAPIDFEAELLARSLRPEGLQNEELLLRNVDGVERRLAMSSRIVCDDAGQVTHAIQVYRDVTEVHELEQTREQYVSLMSHDLRGPLSAARVAAELLSKRLEAGGIQQELAGSVIRSLEQVDRMVRDLLDAQRVRAGEGLSLQLGMCDLVEIARDTVHELAMLHGDRFAVTGPPSLIGCWSGDELRRAIWNLASNAAKYGDTDTPVVIAIEEHDGGAMFAVHNQGQPIPVEDQDRLFDLFARREQDGVRGWGLGLTLVRGVAEAHGGYVKVHSGAASGTTFEVWLPRDARPFRRRS